MGAVLDWYLGGLDANPILFVEATLALILLGVAFAIPGAGDKLFSKAEDRGSAIAKSRWAIWIAFALPVLLRLLTLFIYPPPQPKIHDEFSYLLIADTLLHGRLSNPTHPMWQHLEAIHVIFDPTYASKYPIGQGVALAIPQLFGLPAYVGVWLSCGAMSAAFFWMLRAWVSAPWALLGCSVIYIRVITLSAWMHSYWGGAVSAIGGALAVGGLWRLLKKPRKKYALILGAGLAILANSRPYEGAVLGTILGIQLAWWYFRNRETSCSWKTREVITPLAGVMTATAVFIAFHNYSVTRNPFKLPYMRNRELYAVPQTFYWQPAVPPVSFRHREFHESYVWQLDMHTRGQRLSTLLDESYRKFLETWYFFFSPVWTIPALLPWIRRKREYWMPLAAIVAVLIAVACYPFFFHHYLGPIAGLFLLMMVAGIKMIYHWRPRGKPVGETWCRLVIVMWIAGYFWQLSIDYGRAEQMKQFKMPRTQVVEALEKAGGKHLVIVRYGPTHDFTYDVVYNRADIDASDIVFARDMGFAENEELIQYFHYRKAWLFEPDASPPRLEDYPAHPFKLPTLQ